MERGKHTRGPLLARIGQQAVHRGTHPALGAAEQARHRRPVTRYLHGLPNTWKQVTLSELLDHSSGVPYLTSAVNFGSSLMTSHSKTEVISYIASKATGVCARQQS